MLRSNGQFILAKFVKAGQLRLTDKKPAAAPDFLLDFAVGSFYTHQSVTGWAGFRGLTVVNGYGFLKKIKQSSDSDIKTKIQNPSKITLLFQFVSKLQTNNCLNS